MVERKKIKNLKVFKSIAGALFSQGGVNTPSILSARLSWGCICVGRTGVLCPVLVSESRRPGSELVFQELVSGFTRAGPAVWGQGCPVCVADVAGTDGIVSCRSVPTAWLKAAFTVQFIVFFGPH